MDEPPIMNKKQAKKIACKFRVGSAFKSGPFLKDGHGKARAHLCSDRPVIR